MLTGPALETIIATLTRSKDGLAPLQFPATQGYQREETSTAYTLEPAISYLGDDSSPTRLQAEDAPLPRFPEPLISLLPDCSTAECMLAPCMSTSETLELPPTLTPAPSDPSSRRSPGTLKAALSQDCEPSDREAGVTSAAEGAALMMRLAVDDLCRTTMSCQAPAGVLVTKQAHVKHVDSSDGAQVSQSTSYTAANPREETRSLSEPATGKGATVNDDAVHSDNVFTVASIESSSVSFIACNPPVASAQVCSTDPAGAQLPVLPPETKASSSSQSRCGRSSSIPRHSRFAVADEVHVQTGTLKSLRAVRTSSATLSSSHRCADGSETAHSRSRLPSRRFSRADSIESTACAHPHNAHPTQVGQDVAVDSGANSKTSVHPHDASVHSHTTQPCLGPATVPVNSIMSAEYYVESSRDSGGNAPEDSAIHSKTAASETAVSYLASCSRPQPESMHSASGRDPRECFEAVNPLSSKASQNLRHDVPAEAPPSDGHTVKKALQSALTVRRPTSASPTPTRRGYAEPPKAAGTPHSSRSGRSGRSGRLQLNACPPPKSSAVQPSPRRKARAAGAMPNANDITAVIAKSLLSPRRVHATKPPPPDSPRQRTSLHRGRVGASPPSKRASLSTSPRPALPSSQPGAGWQAFVRSASQSPTHAGGLSPCQTPPACRSSPSTSFSRARRASMCSEASSYGETSLSPRAGVRVVASSDPDWDNDIQVIVPRSFNEHAQPKNVPTCNITQDTSTVNSQLAAEVFSSPSWPTDALVEVPRGSSIPRSSCSGMAVIDTSCEDWDEDIMVVVPRLRPPSAAAATHLCHDRVVGSSEKWPTGFPDVLEGTGGKVQVDVPGLAIRCESPTAKRFRDLEDCKAVVSQQEPIDVPRLAIPEVLHFHQMLNGTDQQQGMASCSPHGPQGSDVAQPACRQHLSPDESPRSVRLQQLSGLRVAVGREREGYQQPDPERLNDSRTQCWVAHSPPQSPRHSCSPVKHASSIPVAPSLHHPLTRVSPATSSVDGGIADAVENKEHCKVTKETPSGSPEAQITAFVSAAQENLEDSIDAHPMNAVVLRSVSGKGGPQSLPETADATRLEQLAVVAGVPAAALRAEGAACVRHDSGTSGHRRRRSRSREVSDRLNSLASAEPAPQPHLPDAGWSAAALAPFHACVPQDLTRVAPLFPGTLRQRYAITAAAIAAVAGGSGSGSGSGTSTVESSRLGSAAGLDAANLTDGGWVVSTFSTACSEWHLSSPGTPMDTPFSLRDNLADTMTGLVGISSLDSESNITPDVGCALNTNGTEQRLGSIAETGMRMFTAGAAEGHVRFLVPEAALHPSQQIDPASVAGGNLLAATMRACVAEGSKGGQGVSAEAAQVLCSTWETKDVQDTDTEHCESGALTNEVHSPLVTEVDQHSCSGPYDTEPEVGTREALLEMKPAVEAKVELVRLESSSPGTSSRALSSLSSIESLAVCAAHSATPCTDAQQCTSDADVVWRVSGLQTSQLKLPNTAGSEASSPVSPRALPMWTEIPMQAGSTTRQDAPLPELSFAFLNNKADVAEQLGDMVRVGNSSFVSEVNDQQSHQKLATSHTSTALDERAKGLDSTQVLERVRLNPSNSNCGSMAESASGRSERLDSTHMLEGVHLTSSDGHSAMLTQTSSARSERLDSTHMLEGVQLQSSDGRGAQQTENASARSEELDSMQGLEGIREVDGHLGTLAQTVTARSERLDSTQLLEGVQPYSSDGNSTELLHADSTRSERLESTHMLVGVHLQSSDGNSSALLQTVSVRSQTLDSTQVVEGLPLPQGTSGPCETERSLSNTVSVYNEGSAYSSEALGGYQHLVDSTGASKRTHLTESSGHGQSCNFIECSKKADSMRVLDCLSWTHTSTSDHIVTNSTVSQSEFNDHCLLLDSTKVLDDLHALESNGHGEVSSHASRQSDRLENTQAMKGVLLDPAPSGPGEMSTVDSGSLSERSLPDAACMGHASPAIQGWHRKATKAMTAIESKHTHSSKMYSSGIDGGLLLRESMRSSGVPLEGEPSASVGSSLTKMPSTHYQIFDDRHLLGSVAGSYSKHNSSELCGELSEHVQDIPKQFGSSTSNRRGPFEVGESEIRQEYLGHMDSSQLTEGCLPEATASPRTLTADPFACNNDDEGAAASVVQDETVSCASCCLCECPDNTRKVSYESQLGSGLLGQTLPCPTDKIPGPLDHSHMFFGETGSFESVKTSCMPMNQVSNNLCSTQQAADSHQIISDRPQGRSMTAILAEAHDNSEQVKSDVLDLTLPRAASELSEVSGCTQETLSVRAKGSEVLTTDIPEATTSPAEVRGSTWQAGFAIAELSMPNTKKQLSNQVHTNYKTNLDVQAVVMTNEAPEAEVSWILESTQHPICEGRICNVPELETAKSFGVISLMQDEAQQRSHASLGRDGASSAEDQSSRPQVSSEAPPCEHHPDRRSVDIRPAGELLEAMVTMQSVNGEDPAVHKQNPDGRVSGGTELADVVHSVKSGQKTFAPDPSGCGDADAGKVQEGFPYKFVQADELPAATTLLGSSHMCDAVSSVRSNQELRSRTESHTISVPGCDNGQDRNSNEQQPVDCRHTPSFPGSHGSFTDESCTFQQAPGSLANTMLGHCEGRSIQLIPSRGTSSEGSDHAVTDCEVEVLQPALERSDPVAHEALALESSVRSGLSSHASICHDRHCSFHHSSSSPKDSVLSNYTGPGSDPGNTHKGPDNQESSVPSSCSYVTDSSHNQQAHPDSISTSVGLVQMSKRETAPMLNNELIDGADNKHMDCGDAELASLCLPQIDDVAVYAAPQSACIQRRIVSGSLSSSGSLASGGIDNSECVDATLHKSLHAALPSDAGTAARPSIISQGHEVSRYVLFKGCSAAIEPEKHLDRRSSDPGRAVPWHHCATDVGQFGCQSKLDLQPGVVRATLGQAGTEQPEADIINAHKTQPQGVRQTESVIASSVQDLSPIGSASDTKCCDAASHELQAGHLSEATLDFKTGDSPAGINCKGTDDLLLACREQGGHNDGPRGLATVLSPQASPIAEHSHDDPLSAPDLLTPSEFSVIPWLASTFVDIASTASKDSNNDLQTSAGSSIGWQRSASGSKDCSTYAASVSPGHDIQSSLHASQTKEDVSMSGTSNPNFHVLCMQAGEDGTAPIQDIFDREGRQGWCDTQIRNNRQMSFFPGHSSSENGSTEQFSSRTGVGDSDFRILCAPKEDDVAGGAAGGEALFQRSSSNEPLTNVANKSTLLSEHSAQENAHEGDINASAFTSNKPVSQLPCPQALVFTEGVVGSLQTISKILSSTDSTSLSLPEREQSVSGTAPGTLVQDSGTQQDSCCQLSNTLVPGNAEHVKDGKNSMQSSMISKNGSILRSLPECSGGLIDVFSLHEHHCASRQSTLSTGSERVKNFSKRSSSGSLSCGYKRDGAHELAAYYCAGCYGHSDAVGAPCLLPGVHADKEGSNGALQQDPCAECLEGARGSAELTCLGPCCADSNASNQADERCDAGLRGAEEVQRVPVHDEDANHANCQESVKCGTAVPEVPLCVGPSDGIIGSYCSLVDATAYGTSTHSKARSSEASADESAHSRQWVSSDALHGSQQGNMTKISCTMTKVGSPEGDSSLPDALCDPWPAVYQGLKGDAPLNAHLDRNVVHSDEVDEHGSHGHKADEVHRPSVAIKDGIHFGNTKEGPAGGDAIHVQQEHGATASEECPQRELVEGMQPDSVPTYSYAPTIPEVNSTEQHNCNTCVNVYADGAAGGQHSSSKEMHCGHCRNEDDGIGKPHDGEHGLKLYGHITFNPDGNHGNYGISKRADGALPPGNKEGRSNCVIPMDDAGGFEMHVDESRLVDQDGRSTEHPICEELSVGANGVISDGMGNTQSTDLTQLQYNHPNHEHDDGNSERYPNEKNDSQLGDHNGITLYGNGGNVVGAQIDQSKEAHHQHLNNEHDAELSGHFDDGVKGLHGKVLSIEHDAGLNGQLADSNCVHLLSIGFGSKRFDQSGNNGHTDGAHDPEPTSTDFTGGESIIEDLEASYLENVCSIRSQGSESTQSNKQSGQEDSMNFSCDSHTDGHHPQPSCDWIPSGEEVFEQGPAMWVEDPPVTSESEPQKDQDAHCAHLTPETEPAHALGARDVPEPVVKQEDYGARDTPKPAPAGRQDAHNMLSASESHLTEMTDAQKAVADDQASDRPRPHGSYQLSDRHDDHDARSAPESMPADRHECHSPCIGPGHDLVDKQDAPDALASFKSHLTEMPDTQKANDVAWAPDRLSLIGGQSEHDLTAEPARQVCGEGVSESRGSGAGGVHDFQAAGGHWSGNEDDRCNSSEVRQSSIRVLAPDISRGVSGAQGSWFGCGSDEMQLLSGSQHPRCVEASGRQHSRPSDSRESEKRPNSQPQCSDNLWSTDTDGRPPDNDKVVNAQSMIYYQAVMEPRIYLDTDPNSSYKAARGYSVTQAHDVIDQQASSLFLQKPREHAASEQSTDILTSERHAWRESMQAVQYSVSHASSDRMTEPQRHRSSSWHESLSALRESDACCAAVEQLAAETCVAFNSDLSVLSALQDSLLCCKSNQPPTTTLPELECSVQLADNLPQSSPTSPGEQVATFSRACHQPALEHLAQQAAPDSQVDTQSVVHSVQRQALAGLESLPESARAVPCHDLMQQLVPTSATPSQAASNTAERTDDDMSSQSHAAHELESLSGSALTSLKITIADPTALLPAISNPQLQHGGAELPGHFQATGGVPRQQHITTEHMGSFHAAVGMPQPQANRNSSEHSCCAVTEDAHPDISGGPRHATDGQRRKDLPPALANPLTQIGLQQHLQQSAGQCLMDMSQLVMPNAATHFSSALERPKDSDTLAANVDAWPEFALSMHVDSGVLSADQTTDATNFGRPVQQAVSDVTWEAPPCTIDIQINSSMSVAESGVTSSALSTQVEQGVPSVGQAVGLVTAKTQTEQAMCQALEVVELSRTGVQAQQQQVQPGMFCADRSLGPPKLGVQMQQGVSHVDVAGGVCLSAAGVQVNSSLPGDSEGVGRCSMDEAQQTMLDFDAAVNLSAVEVEAQLKSLSLSSSIIGGHMTPSIAEVQNSCSVGAEDVKQSTVELEAQQVMCEGDSRVNPAGGMAVPVLMGASDVGGSGVSSSIVLLQAQQAIPDSAWCSCATAMGQHLDTPDVAVPADPVAPINDPCNIHSFWVHGESDPDAAGTRKEQHIVQQGTEMYEFCGKHDPESSESSQLQLAGLVVHHPHQIDDLSCRRMGMLPFSGDGNSGAWMGREIQDVSYLGASTCLSGDSSQGSEASMPCSTNALIALSRASSRQARALSSQFDAAVEGVKDSDPCIQARPLRLSASDHSLESPVDLSGQYPSSPHLLNSGHANSACLEKCKHSVQQTTPDNLPRERASVPWLAQLDVPDVSAAVHDHLCSSMHSFGAALQDDLCSSMHTSGAVAPRSAEHENCLQAVLPLLQHVAEHRQPEPDAIAGCTQKSDLVDDNAQHVAVQELEAGSSSHKNKHSNPLVEGTMMSSAQHGPSSGITSQGCIAGTVQHHSGDVQAWLQGSCTVSLTKGPDGSRGSHNLQIMQEGPAHSFVPCSSPLDVAMCTGLGRMLDSTGMTLRSLHADEVGASSCAYENGRHPDQKSTTQEGQSGGVDAREIEQGTNAAADNMTSTHEDSSNGTTGSASYEAQPGELLVQAQHLADGTSGLCCCPSGSNKACLDSTMERVDHNCISDARPSRKMAATVHAGALVNSINSSCSQAADEKLSPQGLDVNLVALNALGTGDTMQICNDLVLEHPHQESFKNTECGISLPLLDASVSQDACNHSGYGYCISGSLSNTKHNLPASVGPTSQGDAQVPVNSAGCIGKEVVTQKLRLRDFKTVHGDSIMAWPPPDLVLLDLSTADPPCDFPGELFHDWRFSVCYSIR
jgi:hypothetical protein